MLVHSKRSKSARPASSLPKLRTRRVPIEIIDTPPPVGAQEDLLTPVSSRSLDRPTSTVSRTNITPTTDAESPANRQPEQTPSQSTFRETKQTRSTKYGGGIFRSSGSHTIFKPETSSVPRTKPQTGQPAWPAMNLVAFTRSWNTLTTDQRKWTLLQQIPPASLPRFFGSSLEADILSSMLGVLLTVLSTGGSEWRLIKEYMACLPQVPRFFLIYTFLCRDDKNRAKEIWTLLDGGCAASEEDKDTKKLWDV